MRVFLDNRVIKAIIEKKVAPVTGDLIFGWSSLLSYLGLNSLLEAFPEMDLKIILSALDSDAERSEIVHLYDQLFAEILASVKSLKELKPPFLLDSIQKKPSEVFVLPLAHYEKIFQEDPHNALHDLMLYIAWDRACVAVAMIFEQSGSNAKIRKNLDVLKGCLVESFQHIMEQGKTVPSFFRLMEAFYAYDMREDNLQLHTDEEWLTLCQGARALKAREYLPDAFYIDASVIPEYEPKTSLKFVTMDTEEKVKSGQSLAVYTMRKLKKEYPGWRYTLCPVEFVFVQNQQGV